MATPTLTQQDGETQIRDRVLQTLRDTVESDDVLRQPDLRLYASGLLDSLGTVTLMVALGEAFSLEISPADFDRAAWETPSALVSDIARRIAERDA